MRSYARPAAPALVVALADDAAAVRLRAVIALGWFCAGERRPFFTPPPAERWLGEGFGHWTPEHVGEEGRAAAAAALAARLHDSDADVRAEAGRALAGMGAAARPATAALVRALVRGDPHAAAALGAIGVEAAPRVRPLVRHERADVRTRALEVLAAMDPVPVTDLALGLADADTEVREQTARMLAHLGPGASAATPALADALADKTPGVRGLVARALRKIGPAAADAAPALADALADEDGQVAIAAARALAAVDPGRRERAFLRLVDLMEHQYSGVRNTAAYYLPELAPPGNGVRALMRRTADEDHDVRITAALSLWRILHAKTIADSAAEAKRLLEGGPPASAEPGLGTAITFDPRDVPIKVLTGGAGHADAAVRLRAVHALGRIVEEALAAGERFGVTLATFHRRADVERALRKALDDTGDGVRAAAARALEPLTAER